jgi:hypothetical protein
MARPFFARERISDFDIFEKHTAKTLAILSSFSCCNLPCDAQDLYSRFSLDAASEFLFGRNLDTLSASLPVAGRTPMGPKGSATYDTWGSFTHAFEMSQQIVTRRARLGYFWPVSELFGDKSAQYVQAIRRWLDPIVVQSLADKAQMGCAGLNSPVEEKTFLQHLTESTEGRLEYAINDHQVSTYLHPDTTLIRDQLLNILLASRDTACLSRVDLSICSTDFAQLCRLHAF